MLPAGKSRSARVGSAERAACWHTVPAPLPAPFLSNLPPLQHYDSHYDSFPEEDYGPQYSQRVGRWGGRQPAGPPHTVDGRCAGGGGRARRRPPPTLPTLPLRSPTLKTPALCPLQIATVLVYLTDVEEGGETSFLLEGKDGLPRLQTIDYKKCDTGIKVRRWGRREAQVEAGRARARHWKQRRHGGGSRSRTHAPRRCVALPNSLPQVKPRRGDALLFWNTHVNGTIDKHSLHGGCPVVAGTKWVRAGGAEGWGGPGWLATAACVHAT